MRKFISKEVPQANDIDRIVEIIVSINRLKLPKPRYINIAYDLLKNESSFVTNKAIEYYKKKESVSVAFMRDVRYYKDAADILKLSNFSTKFLSLTTHNQKVFLRNRILNSEIIKSFIKNRSFKDFRALVYTPDEAKKYTDSSKRGLVDRTLKRRIGTIESWLKYCDLVEETNQESIIDGKNNKIITIEKDNQKLERAVNAHKELVEMMKNHLKKKNVLVYEDNLVDLVYSGEDNIFFEMKSITDENKGNQFKKALGQLIFYKNYYNSKSKLVVVLEKYIEEADYLINDDIDVIWKDGYFFNSDDLTKKKLKIIFSD